MNPNPKARVGFQPTPESTVGVRRRCGNEASAIEGGKCAENIRCADKGLLHQYSATTHSVLCQNLEARVGIEQVLLPSEIPPKPFGSGYFSKCCTDKENIKVR